MAKVSFSPRKVTISMNASDWELYSSMDGVEDVATKISQEVEVAINESKTKKEASSKVFKVLETYREFGAYDSEPYRTAQNLLDRAFDKDEF